MSVARPFHRLANLHLHVNKYWLRAHGLIRLRRVRRGNKPPIFYRRVFGKAGHLYLSGLDFIAVARQLMSWLKCAMECQSNGFSKTTLLSCSIFFFNRASCDFVVVFDFKFAVILFGEGTVRLHVADFATSRAECFGCVHIIFDRRGNCASRQISHPRKSSRWSVQQHRKVPSPP